MRTTTQDLGTMLMQTWEYRVIRQNMLNSFATELSNAGSEGWELVSVMRDPHGYYHGFMKKPGDFMAAELDEETVQQLGEASRRAAFKRIFHQGDDHSASRPPGMTG